MSVRLMSDIWSGGRYEGGTLLVLLALADWANDDGTKVHPGIETLALKARLSERQTQRVLRKLVDDGVIVATESAKGGRGKVTHYRIVLERVTFCPEPNGAQKRVTSKAEKGDAGDAQRVTSETQRVTSATAHIDNHQEPPKTHQDPSPPFAALGGFLIAFCKKAGKQKSKRGKLPYSDAFERVWNEFRKVPGFHDNMSKFEAWEAFQNAPGRPDPAVLIVCIRKWAAKRATGAGKRGFEEAMCHPTTWINQRRWEGFLDASGAPAPDAKSGPNEGDDPRDADIRANLGEATDRLVHGRGDVAGIGWAKLRAWFDDCRFIEPGTFLFASKWKAGEVGNQFLGKMRCFFGDEVKIEFRPNAARAA